MNVVSLEVFAGPAMHIIFDVLICLSVLGAAVLMLLALLGQANSPAGKRTGVVVLVQATAASRPRHGATLHPWEFSCAGGATRAPPRIPPIQQVPLLPTSVGVAAPVVRLGVRC